MIFYFLKETGSLVPICTKSPLHVPPLYEVSMMIYTSHSLNLRKLFFHTGDVFFSVTFVAVIELYYF
jgi:hypothetical protein